MTPGFPLKATKCIEAGNCDVCGIIYGFLLNKCLITVGELKELRDIIDDELFDRESFG